MQTILISGANGFLGQHLSVFLDGAGYQVVATGRGESRLADKRISYAQLDLTDKEQVKRVLTKYQPVVVIHNAAMSKPDECYDNQSQCVMQNVGTTQELLQHPCKQFIYLSTDFIFGEGGPHSEEDEAAPLNFYGETKLAAEKLVKESGANYGIVRPVFIYGKLSDGLKPTFLHWVVNNLQQGKAIKVTADQFRTPTYVEDICKGIFSMIELNAGGVYHLAGKDILSPYEMAIKTASILNLDESLIESVTADTFPEKVVRAKRSGLKIEKAMRELAYNPVSFEEGVRLTFGL